MQRVIPSDFLKTIKIIHLSLIGGAFALSSALAFLIFTSPNPQFIDPNDILLFALIGLFILLTPLAFFVSKRILKMHLLGKTELTDKLAAYQTSHLVKIAMLDGIVMFAFVVGFSTNTYAPFLISGPVLLLMLLSLPTAFKITEDLNLTPQESSQLNK